MNTINEKKGDKKMELSEKIVSCTDKILQNFMRKTDSTELVNLMTYDFTEDACECIFRNMSERAKTMLKEDIEYFKNTKERFQNYLDESIQKFREG
jgi:flagellar motor switch protein FliG